MLGIAPTHSIPLSFISESWGFQSFGDSFGDNRPLVLLQRVDLEVSKIGNEALFGKRRRWYGDLFHPANRLSRSSTCHDQIYRIRHKTELYKRQSIAISRIHLSKGAEWYLSAIPNHRQSEMPHDPVYRNDC